MGRSCLYSILSGTVQMTKLILTIPALFTIPALAAVMIVSSMAGTAYAGLVCPPDVTGTTVSDVEVNGACVIGTSGSDVLTGNVKLDTDGDWLNFNFGTIIGNLKCKNSWLPKLEDKG